MPKTRLKLQKRICALLPYLVFMGFVPKRREFVGKYYSTKWRKWQDGRGARNREKSAGFGKLEKIGEIWELLGDGKSGENRELGRKNRVIFGRSAG